MNNISKKLLVSFKFEFLLYKKICTKFRRKIFIVVTVFSLCVLCGCGEKDINKADRAVFVSPSPTLKVESIEDAEESKIIEGKAIEDMGYQFLVPADFENGVSPWNKSKKDGDKEPSIKYNQQNVITNEGFAIPPEIFGMAGTINVNIYEENPNSLEIGSLSLLHLQAFEKKEIKIDSIISIGDIQYSISEFDTRIIAENENLVIYNISDLVWTYAENFEEYAAKLYAPNLKDMVWAKQVREYFLKNMDKAIVPIDYTVKK